MFKSWLIESKTTKARFRWKVSPDEALMMLREAYQRQVESRGMRTELTPEIEAYLKQVADQMTSGNTKCGILLCGNCGNGKTTTMEAFRSVSEFLSLVDHNHNVIQGQISKRVTVQSTSARRLSQVAKDENSMNEAKTVGVLCIDDLGLEPTEVLDYGNAINPVIEIMEHRYRQQLFTFITTNLTPAQIREKYGDRIADRFNEIMKCIVFKNPSFRK